MPIANTQSINIHYEVAGNGPALVLINGLADDLSAWGFQTEAFAEHFTVITFDNRGVGATDKPKGVYTTKEMAHDTAQLLDYLQIPSAHILGTSMGGMIAQEFAIAFPERVNKLILSCTCAEPSPANLRLYKIWQDTAPILGLPQLMKEVLLWCFTPEFFARQPELAQEFEQAITGITQPLEAYLAQLNSIQTHNATSRLHTIQAPTLVLGGPDDLLFPPAQSEQLHQAIKGSQLRFTANGGHANLWEVPEQFNAEVLRFLFNE